MNATMNSMTHTLAGKLGRWLTPLTAVVCAGLLAACGGGGGSPGANGNGTPPVVVSKVATVSLVASAVTIDSSGADGTEVTLTAIVKDANSNALAGETVEFKSDSGIISNTNRVSNSSGAVVEKISVKDNAAPRVITITANVGTVVSTAVKITVVVAMPTLTLTADRGQLASSGAAGSEVNLVALVKDSNNNVVPGMTVGLSSDSGNLTYTNRVTDAKGAVAAKLDIGGDPTSRTITVTATTTGAKAQTISLTVAGNKLVINNSGTIKVGSSTDIAVKLVDSSGNALAGKAVTFASSVTGNTLSVKDGGSAVTNSAGQLVLSYKAVTAGVDTITVKSMGETASSSINVSASNFTVNAVDGAGAPLATASINSCQKVAIHYDIANVPQPGAVALSISRGGAFSDSGCSSAIAAPLTLVNGNVVGYVKASSPGVGTLTATIGGLTTQGTLEFLAPLTAASTVSVQADPAVLGVNTDKSTTQQATLRAIVLDGTAANNLVKNAQVAFTIVNDPSGGTLTQPSVVTTGADGTASISYVAGSTATQLDGVVIQAQLQGASTATGTVKLTVAKKSLFITAGTGSTVGTPTDATYQLDYAVFVADAAGNPVPGVNITSSVRPRYFYKGQLAFIGTQGPWDVSTQPGLAPVACPNEDVNSDGILQANEDYNGDKILTPGNAVLVTPTATTDARGMTTVSLLYARDRAKWLDVDLTIRGQVSGSEARYVAYFRLPGLSTDYSTLAVSPPGRYSPYGIENTPPVGDGTLSASCYNTK